MFSNSNMFFFEIRDFGRFSVGFGSVFDRFLGFPGFLGFLEILGFRSGSSPFLD